MGILHATMRKICHFADIHVKNTRREEYAAVFDSAIQKVKEEKPDLCVIAGDLFDMKTYATSQNWRDIAKYIFIPKNTTSFLYTEENAGALVYERAFYRVQMSPIPNP